MKQTNFKLVWHSRPAESLKQMEQIAKEEWCRIPAVKYQKVEDLNGCTKL